MFIPGLRIDWDSSVPVYRQIADAVRAAARDGHIRSGHRLPATRDLAKQLGVNRNTAIAAYDTLAGQGWIESRTGKGTFLVVPSDPADAQDAEPGAGSWVPAFSRAAEAAVSGGLQSIYRLAIASEGISFVGSYPAGELLPLAPFQRAMSTALRDHGSNVLSYGPTAGHPPLRETVADTMRAVGSSVDASTVLITNGAQQAVELVFRALVDRGETVAIEDPTYTGALSVLGSLGARVVGVPVDREGLRPDLLEVVLERDRPRLIYVQPTFQNPTACVMSESRRHELLALARRYRCPVVEDDWGGDLRLDGEELPTLHALDDRGQVIYISTFSKKLMPGLRLGWVAAPPAVFERLVELKRIQDCGSSPMLQSALHTFLCDGGLDRHLHRVLPAYRARRDAMLAALERHFPGEAAWERPAGGLFVWVRLPPHIDANELFLAARPRGVLFSRGELFHTDGSGRNCLRLTYSAARPEQIETGVALLGGLIRERWPEGSDPTRQPSGEAMPIF